MLEGLRPRTLIYPPAGVFSPQQSIKTSLRTTCSISWKLRSSWHPSSLFTQRCPQLRSGFLDASFNTLGGVCNLSHGRHTDIHHRQVIGVYLLYPLGYIRISPWQVKDVYQLLSRISSSHSPIHFSKTNQTLLCCHFHTEVHIEGIWVPVSTADLWYLAEFSVKTHLYLYTSFNWIASKLLRINWVWTRMTSSGWFLSRSLVLLLLCNLNWNFLLCGLTLSFLFFMFLICYITSAFAVCFVRLHSLANLSIQWRFGLPFLQVMSIICPKTIILVAKIGLVMATIYPLRPQSV